MTHSSSFVGLANGFVVSSSHPRKLACICSKARARRLSPASSSLFAAAEASLLVLLRALLAALPVSSEKRAGISDDAGSRDLMVCKAGMVLMRWATSSATIILEPGKLKKSCDIR